MLLSFSKYVGWGSFLRCTPINSWGWCCFRWSTWYVLGCDNYTHVISSKHNGGNYSNTSCYLAKVLLAF